MDELTTSPLRRRSAQLRRWALVSRERTLTLLILSGLLVVVAASTGCTTKASTPELVLGEGVRLTAQAATGDVSVVTGKGLARTYRGGYKQITYDVIPLIHQLLREGTSHSLWKRIWADLHHQGDVGEATYAFVPYLVEYQGRQRELDEQIFQFCVVVDLALPEGSNPPIPPELELPYAIALRKLPAIGTDLMRRGCSQEVLMGIAAATALAAGNRVLARAYLEFGRAAALSFLRELNGYEPGPVDE
jgi:hypothetical protein